MKPLQLVKDTIKDCSNKNDIILDLFGGSGTTMVAAHKTGRTAYLSELDPKYVNVIIRRMLEADDKLKVICNGNDMTAEFSNYEKVDIKTFEEDNKKAKRNKKIKCPKCGFQWSEK